MSDNEQNTNEVEAENIVDEHRRMVIMTGNISDFQIQNLKSWPFLVFGDSLEKVEIGYKFTKTQDENSDLCAGSVSYDFYFSKEPADVENNLGLLTHWTQFLFWKDTEVTFSKEGEAWPKKK